MPAAFVMRMKELPDGQYEMEGREGTGGAEYA